MNIRIRQICRKYSFRFVKNVEKFRNFQATHSKVTNDFLFLIFSEFLCFFLFLIGFSGDFGVRVCMMEYH